LIFLFPQIIDQITKKRTQKPPASNQYEEVPKLVVYFALKDQNVAFLPLSKKILVEALDEILPELSKLEKLLKSGSNVNMQKFSMLQEFVYKIPTSTGMPLTASLKIPSMIGFNGKVQVTKDAQGSGNFRAHIDADFE